MILGVSGFVKGDWKNIDEIVMDKVASLGFKTLQIRISDPFSTTLKDIEKIKTLYKKFDFYMPQTVGNYGGNLISKNKDLREKDIIFLKRMIDITNELESPNTYLRPGSHNINGAWKPHKNNYNEKTWDTLIESTKFVCDYAEKKDVMIAVEGGVACPVNSPKKVKDLFEKVDSKNLGLNMDPVNFIKDLDTAYKNTDLINEFYHLIPHNIIGCHAKDFKIVEGLLPHFEETIIGSEDSMLDNDSLLKGLSKINPKAHVLIEHLADEDIPKALAGLNNVAKRNKIIWDD